MKKKNGHTNLVLSASAGMLIISICTFIYIYNDIFPDTKKFNAEVWGTVSDWMVIAITVVTAVYLYRTLKSQMEVQKMQQEITQIETHIFRERIRPILNILDQEYDPTRFKISFKISIQQNSLKHPKFISPIPLRFKSHTIINITDLSEGYLYALQDYILPEDKRTIDLEIDLDINKWQNGSQLHGKFDGCYMINIAFHYQDIKNYPYENIIAIVIKPSENFIKISLGDPYFE